MKLRRYYCCATWCKRNTTRVRIKNSARVGKRSSLVSRERKTASRETLVQRVFRVLDGPKTYANFYDRPVSFIRYNAAVSVSNFRAHIFFKSFIAPSDPPRFPLYTHSVRHTTRVRRNIETFRVFFRDILSY